MKNAILKKIFKIISKILGYLFIFVLVLYICINIFFPKEVITIFKYQFYVIQTSSMSPDGINIGDLVIIEEINFSKLEENDIISFYVDANTDGKIDVVTHYFVSKETDSNGKVLYRTRAAGRTTLDGWRIPKEDIIGEYVTHIPKIGKLVLYLRSPIGLVTIVVDIIIIGLIFFFTGEKKPKKKEYEEIHLNIKF